MAGGTKRNTNTSNQASRTSSRKKKTVNQERQPKTVSKTRNADVSFHNEIVVLLVLAFSVLLLLSNFQLCGPVGEVLTNLTFGLFGVLGYLVPIILLVGTCYYVAKRNQQILVGRLLCILGIFVVVCGICQLLAVSGQQTVDLSWQEIYRTAMGKKGGGLLGGCLVKCVYPLFGAIASYVIHIALLLILIVCLTGLSLTEMVKDRSSKVAQRASKAQEHHKELQEVKEHEREAMRQMRLEQKKLDSERRIEQARKEHEARMALAGHEVSDSDHSTLRVEKDNLGWGGTIVGNEEGMPASEMTNGRIKNPVLNEKSKKKTLFPSFLSDNDESKASQREETSEPAISPAMQSVTVTYDNQTRSVPLHETADDTSSTDAPKFDESKVISASDKSAVIEKMKRSGTNADGTKTIVTASGKVITMEMDMGSESHVAPMKREDGETTIFEDVSKAMQPIKPVAIQKKEYVFPPIGLLTKGQASGRNMDQELRETALKLQQTLRNFGVGVTVTNVSCGPAVTRYELQPEQGVKVSKVVGLHDDIKLNMAAADIRIEAPIPGKAAIGIEIPNKESASVMLRDLLESPEFVNHPSRLAFGAGKDIGGQTIVADVAKMPHLLIAGATGSGKSVCINTIIMSILYKAKPSEVKLIMIDPKVVELSVYNGIPHLMIPVVTDPKKAAGALSWAVAEMTQRYKKFAEYAVRDLKGYNEKIKEQYDGPQEYRPASLPQIVIIVDELADLMMVAPGEVEDSICRLAQMARAAGIHLILATQRPSVNVITGVIKANVPSRIAFSVSSGVDSRTILDMVGAEKLLGRGDMLYYPAGMQKPIRVQGAFVSDKEVSTVVEFLTKQENVVGGEMEDSIEQHIENASSVALASANAVDTQENDRYALDPLFREAGIMISGKDKASIGMLQRYFRIGFNRAARIMEQLAEAGLVGEEEGTKPRKILMDETEFLSYCEENQIP